MPSQVVPQGFVSRSLPTARGDAVSIFVPSRYGKYNEQYVQNVVPDKYNLADEGSYYVATNPTIGTAIAVTTSITSFAETAGAVGVGMMLKNADLSTSTKRIYLDYIKLMIVQVPTSATSWQWALVLDDNPVRYTSGGSAITSIANVNGDFAMMSVAQMYFGALTTAVPTNRRTVGRGTFRGVIPTTFDEMIINFGGVDAVGSVASAAASARTVDMGPPVVIKGQQQVCLTMWGAANAAAPSFEFEIAWWER